MHIISKTLHDHNKTKFIYGPTYAHHLK